MLRRDAIAAILACLSLPALADDASALLARLHKMYPATQFDRVEATAVLPGLFEITMGRNIVYTNKDGRYFVFGHVYDMAKQVDLTAEKTAAMPDAPKPAFADLPLNDAIRTVRGDGHRQLAVFADPNCAYCRRLEANLARIRNVTVYTFLAPVLGEESVRLAEQIQCAPDPAGAWAALMRDGTPPTNDGRCDAAKAVQRNLTLARQVGVRGTPTYLAADGTVGTGAIPSATIEALLGQ